MAETISCRKVYKFGLEPTELEKPELERTASVAPYICNCGLARCRGLNSVWVGPEDQHPVISNMTMLT